VEASVVTGVEKRVESDDAARRGPLPSLHLRLLGPMTVSRGGVAIALPSSRKLRALLAYLAVSPQPVTRSRLCELLWDVPNDPRGELRWCLSKLRRALDDPDRRRVATDGDTVGLDLSDCSIDVTDVIRAASDGIETLDEAKLLALSRHFAGEFLDGMEIERSPHFNAWLTAERRRFRGRHVAILEHLVRKAPGEEIFGHLEKWLQLAPFDRSVHEILLNALARFGRIPEGEKHLAATSRLFESEGLDPAPIRDAWRAVRTQTATPTSAANPARPIVLAEAASVRAPEPAGTSSANSPAMSRRASIAVMPFASRGGLRVGYGDGLVHDVITRLAKLRSLFVIAQGTVFALHERSVDPEAAGRTLNVDYIVTGWVQNEGQNVTVAVELTETRTARIVWTEVFSRKLDDAFLVLEEIGNRIVASIASEIETAERNRAILKPPSSLDAWEAYHRGLWHMYRFERTDNDRARQFFEMAVRLDPTFARAYAGLSFTHWQSAFQGWAPREQEIDLAFDFAGQSMMADDRDPSAHWAMGRALWLRGRQDQSVAELGTAVDLSPNFALGYYSLAFVHAQAGDAQAAIGAADHSRHLSPYDPMLFAMLASRALALVRLGNFAEASDWAVKAASRPNAHPHILAIAAYFLALAGRLEEARTFAATVDRIVPGYTAEDSLRAFQMEPHAAALFRKGARLVGMA
jgi:DNA-binding SARP family transcriptional activator/tetratricopeptide (TPR) repeat protein